MFPKCSIIPKNVVLLQVTSKIMGKLFQLHSQYFELKIYALALKLGQSNENVSMFHGLNYIQPINLETKHKHLFIKSCL
jgi:hypothetical protein